MQSSLKRVFVAFAALLALGALTATSAFASGKPFVETTAATQIGDTWATLNGVVNPNGAATEYYFEYGTTTSYGQTTAVVSAGSGTTNLEESKVVFELKPKVKYHFRIVAKNSNGTTDGADEGFTGGRGNPGLPEFAVGTKESWPASFEVLAGSSTWHLPNGGEWECSSIAGLGTIAGAKGVINTALDFKGCKYDNDIWCTSEGAEKGEIRTTAAEGTLVYLSKAAKTVGIDFKPTGRWTCQATGEIRGSVVMPITSVNVRTDSCALKTAGNQEFENRAGEKETASLETDWPSTWGPLSWEFNSTLTTSKNIEIKA